jgi:DNA-directed RNA polymerase I subunit RPA1
MVDYQYDTASSKWAQWTVQLPLAKCKLDVPSIIRSSVEQYVVQVRSTYTRCMCVSTRVQETKGIRKCGVRAEKNGTLVLQTQGINLHALYAHGQMLQLNKIYTNCIHTVASTYGIEAAARAIKKVCLCVCAHSYARVQEVSSVFGVYGIEVDPRHLTLTGDYMTCVGDIRAFNRQYMSTSGSPLQQMSFETTSVFMRQSMLSGFGDHCMSPSSCVVIGRPFACGGTGCFDLRVPTAHLIDGFLRDDERQTGT